MLRLHLPGLDLQKTADCGQCFRMAGVQGHYTLIAYGQRLQITALTDDYFLFDCSRQAYQTMWRPYFDLDCDYDALLPPTADDDFFAAAAAHARGLRLLRQQPWEALVTFIISQRKNIPAIRACVEKLCLAFGQQHTVKGQPYHAFPNARALAQASLEQLAACSLGYRARYIQQTAQLVAGGAADLDAFAALDDAALRQALMALPGVGVKVAHCVMLFGYRRLDAVPVDVWMDRVIQREYRGHFPIERFGGCAGLAQQYLFYYARSTAYAPGPKQRASAQNQ